MSDFEYQTVDVPTRDGRPEIDVTCNLMGQEGWRPVSIISPSPAYATHSILFEREKVAEREDTRPRAWRGNV